MMTEQITTIARPYALAAFECALEKQDLAGWEAMLQNAALIAQDQAMAQLLHSPKVTSKELVTIFFDILSKQLDAEKKNFVHLLAEYNRLEALPDIAELFIKYRADYEKTMTVQVVSAIDLNEATQQKLVGALTQRLKRKVTLACETDPALIGGALIRMGDKVIDGSIRGKLHRMIEFI